jgi:hypothetical protein
MWATVIVMHHGQTILDIHDAEIGPVDRPHIRFVVFSLTQQGFHMID